MWACMKFSKNKKTNDSTTAEVRVCNSSILEAEQEDQGGCHKTEQHCQNFSFIMKGRRFKEIEPKAKEGYHSLYHTNIREGHIG